MSMATVSSFSRKIEVPATSKYLMMQTVLCTIQKRESMLYSCYVICMYSSTEHDELEDERSIVHLIQFTSSVEKKNQLQ